MKATVVDLRYKMKEVLEALDRNEDVQILYHGKVKGTITASRTPTPLKVSEHPFFYMSRKKGAAGAVEKEMDKLRGGRHRDL